MIAAVPEREREYLLGSDQATSQPAGRGDIASTVREILPGGAGALVDTTTSLANTGLGAIRDGGCFAARRCDPAGVPESWSPLRGRLRRPSVRPQPRCDASGAGRPSPPTDLREAALLHGGLWILGGVLEPDRRLAVWGAALAVDLLAPIIGYPTPRLGRSRTADYEIEGGHFAERCQGFVIIALGESIVVTGATGADAGLTTTTLAALVLAFLRTATLWWLYFDATAANSREDILASKQAGRLARDAFTYLHVPIVAGIIAVAVGDDLLLAHLS